MPAMKAKERMTEVARDLDQLSIDTIRTLSMDGVQKANSGHPGTPMALAPVAYTLFTRVLRHSPHNPTWTARDRFILSAGHASMLLYSTLHLTGYGISLEDLQTIFSQVSFVNVIALDELLNVGGERGDKLSLVDTLEDTRAENPVEVFEAEETKYLLSRAINTLPEREKIVVTLYYYEGLTLAEIGQVLGVTESRICQMHTKAVLQLRGKLADQKD